MRAERLMVLLGALLGVRCGGPPPALPPEGASARPTERTLRVDEARSVSALLGQLGPSALLGVTHLDLGGLGLGPELGFALASTPSLSGLRGLDLSDNDLGADGVTALAHAEVLSSLTALDLGGNDLGDAGAIVLSQSSALSGLRQLDLSGNSIGDRGVAALVRGTLQQLEALDLSMNDFGAAGAAALSRPEALPRLQGLELVGVALGAEARAQLDRRWGQRVRY